MYLPDIHGKRYNLRKPGNNRQKSRLLGWLPVTSCRLPVTGYQLPVAGYQLPVTGYQLPVAGCRLPVTSYRLPVTSHPLPVTSCISCQLPVANCWFPVTHGPFSTYSPAFNGILRLLVFVPHATARTVYASVTVRFTFVLLVFHFANCEL